ncbi:histidine kinase N-terminal 7TM domain-containing protein [Lacrimispora saccharolytica]|uniref:Signal transduction histidine kinase, LytS n=1 Tax=Lacrimispora saccharolytica (strain ATCC 35040 / DSM 2544 / NRCC 2533 / WM1) TaxID=610130 RepID=D9R5N1_LACSW|nr:histidine kinase N-terminal 7TM domain-containing protein [Lacrimispora saccharolytica]ADL05214.1 signal transduction histidine kinase, LytS [[Clostridium] saccharolyticum WM1]QRV20608.1 histidine kinase [Lacrimispora saccharolytica]
MDIVKLIFTLLLSSSVVCAFLLIKYASKRHSMPGAGYFILLLVSTAVSNIAYTAEINALTLSAALIWFYIQHFSTPLQHYFWMMLSLEYSEAPKWIVRKAKYIGLLHPALFYLIFFTNHLHHQYISSYSFVNNGHFEVILSAKEPLYMLMVASGTLIGIISMIFYIWGLMRSPRLHRYGYLIMMVASFIPWITVYLIASNTNYLGIDYFPVVSILSGILYMLGIFKFRIFNAIPIATSIVFRQSKEGVIIVDLEDQIIDANDSFTELYPDLKGRLHQYTLRSFTENHAELKGVYGENPVFTYSLTEEGTERHYQAEITKVMTDDELEIGKVLTIMDITLFVEKQKNLESIASTAIDQAETCELSFLQAQIKPHFLNNTLSVIGSMVTRSPQEAKALIAELGEHLANCYYFDSNSPMVLLEKELECVRTYVSIEKARFRERLNFHLEYDDIPSISIPRLVLQPLVENALRHGILKKAGEGNVWLTICVEENRFRFEVRDDGAGMSHEILSRLLLDTENIHSIGLSNIHRRLMKHYGQGLTITSEPGVGTQVVFYVPETAVLERAGTQ